MMCTYFDIMADTAGYGGRMVSPLSGLNRTNENILLYNHSCKDLLMSCKGFSKTLLKIPLKENGIRFAHFLFKILSVIHRVSQLYLHCKKKYRPIVSALSTKNRCSAYGNLISKTACI